MTGRGDPRRKRPAADRSGTARELARLVGRAHEDLADAALLAANGRRNAALLTGHAVRHALRAVSLSEGLESGDDLPLDVLLRAVPPDHLLARETAALATPPSLEQAGRLVAALADAFGIDPARPNDPAARPVPLRAPRTESGGEAEARPVRTPRSQPESRLKPQPKPGPKPQPEPQPKSELPPERPPARPPERLAGRLAAPERATALSFAASFGPAPTARARADKEESYPGAEFWALIDRWDVPDLEALALIGHEGGLSKSGTRPRFRLRGDEARRFAGLRALDTALAVMGIPPPPWLRTAQRQPPYAGRTPLQVLREGGEDGATAVHHQLTREGLSRALSQAGTQAGTQSGTQAGTRTGSPLGAAGNRRRGKRRLKPG